MSAFGRRSGGGGAGGGRPQFGTAQPMKGPGPIKPGGDGGSQFPPIEPEAIGVAEDSFVPIDRGDAMARLADRQAASGEQSSSRSEGFEASIHRIKEQVLPRLLERVGFDRRKLGAALVRRARLRDAGPLHRLGGAEAGPARGTAASSESTHLVVLSRICLFGRPRIGG